MFWVLFVRKYSKLIKFNQKIDSTNSRMPRKIFMDSVDKLAFYIGMYRFHVIFWYD